MSILTPTIFRYQDATIRTLFKNGEPWFVAADVCKMLGLGNVSYAVNGNAAREDIKLDEDEKGIYNIETPGGHQKMLCVSEPGLYTLIFNSRKPAAKQLKRWITHEIIPTIRKNGVYTMPQLPEGSTDTIEARVTMERINSMLEHACEPMHAVKDKVIEVLTTKLVNSMASSWDISHMGGRFLRGVGSSAVCKVCDDLVTDGLAIKDGEGRSALYGWHAKS